jgi:Ca2+-binding RTX toxin-like protein
MTRITRKLALAGMLAAAISGAEAGSAVAADGGGLTCSTAEGQQVLCAGSVMDATVAGRGAYRLGGSYSDDTCLVGNGRGSFTANLPVVSALGERTLTIDADYAYVRTGAVRIASGYAIATITDYPINFFGGNPNGETTESARLPFSSIAVATGEPGLDGCPLMRPTHWVEQIGLGAAAQGARSNEQFGSSQGGRRNTAGLRPGACANPRSGTNGADRLTGTVAGDALSGLGGGDELAGVSGHDCLNGGTGADALNGGSGHDALRGGAGNDVLRGGAGSDALKGAAGADRFSGGPGRDVIDSRDGLAETVSCGAGKDSARADAGDRLSGCEARLVAG